MREFYVPSVEVNVLGDMFVCLCLTSLQQQGHLETAPPIYFPLRRT